MEAQDLIDHLQLKKHPEGGWYHEFYRSKEQISPESLKSKYNSPRSLGTSIYFLLNKKETSKFHRLKSDELWYFHKGTALTLYQINPSGLLIKTIVGPNLSENLQVLIPAGDWFAAEVNDKSSFCLMGCVVVPGFDFADFELAKSDVLIEQFQQHKTLIKRLT